MKLRRADFIFITLIIIITIISIDLLTNIAHQEAVENVSNYAPFQNLATGLLITFWICAIGNLLPVPTPYTWVVCFSSLPFRETNPFIPFLIAFIASLGCLVGEIIGYAIARSSSRIISEERIKELKNLQSFLVEHPKLAPFLIFLFGLTPLNDDLLIIPLGLIKYDYKRTIFFCWLGKLGMMLIFAYNFINICQFIGGESWMLSIVSLYILVTLIYIFIRVDFLDLGSKLRIKFARN